MAILIIEANEALRTPMQWYLQRAGYAVEAVPDLAAADRRLASQSYHFVLVAQVLPDGNGPMWLRRLARRENQHASFILLTATAAVEHRLRGFAAGADFGPLPAQPVYLPELERRLRSIARQRLGRQRPKISFGAGFVLDLAARLLRHGSQAVHLSRSQFDLLHYLLQHRGRAITRQQLSAHIGKDSDDSNFIDVHIMNVRKVLGQFAPPDFLQTVRGIGYRVA